MDRYSLLKRTPALRPPPRTLPTATTTNSLYRLLESIPDGKTKGLKVVAVDGPSRRIYEVQKYERYKAGLMGRVWLNRVPSASSPAKLIDDTDALGLKWHLQP